MLSTVFSVCWLTCVWCWGTGFVRLFTYLCLVLSNGNLPVTGVRHLFCPSVDLPVIIYWLVLSTDFVRFFTYMWLVFSTGLSVYRLTYDWCWGLVLSVCWPTCVWCWALVLSVCSPTCVWCWALVCLSVDLPVTGVKHWFCPCVDLPVTGIEHWFCHCVDLPVSGVEHWFVLMLTYLWLMLSTGLLGLCWEAL